MRALSGLAEALALAAAALLLALAVLTVADVAGRGLLGSPMLGYHDVAGLTSAVAVAGFFPLLALRGGHIVLRPFAALRAGRFLDALGGVATAAFFALMAWQYVGFSAEMWSSGERMIVLRWPVAPFWWVVTGLVGLTALAAAAVALRRRPD
jgi:TRAP-type C4-dicarboxylate transport system permease small subunit